MILTGKLKENVEKAESVDQAKKIIKDTMEDAGIILDDKELDQAAGGLAQPVARQNYYIS